MENASKLPPRQKQGGGEYDFLLNFQAARVPESGWDKLVVSMVSSETGKVVSRTSRGLVCNRTCRWPDTVTKSLNTNRNHNEKPYKLVVQMGSLRVGVLGETYINLMDFINAKTPITVALPLQNCKTDTILNVKIHCLTSGNVRSRSASLDQQELGSIPEENCISFNKSQARSTHSSLSEAKHALLALPNAQVQIKTKSTSSPANSFRTSFTSSEFSRLMKADHYKSTSMDSSDSSNAPASATSMHQNGSSRSNSSSSFQRDGPIHDPSRFDRTYSNNVVGFTASLATNMLPGGTIRSSRSSTSFQRDQHYYDTDDSSNRLSRIATMGAPPSATNMLRNGSSRTSSSPASFERASINSQKSDLIKDDSNSNRNASRNQIDLNFITAPPAINMAQSSSRSLHRKQQSGGSECYNWEGEQSHFGVESETRIVPHKLQVAETTIQELRGKVATWEQQARKLGIEMENLKQQLLAEQKNGMELKIEMSALEAECSSLRAEVEQLKSCKLIPKKWDSDSMWNIENCRRLIKALQEEVTYEKEASQDLRIQLRQTQNLNLELLCAVAELEEKLQATNNKQGEGVTEANQAFEKELQKQHINNMENRLCNGCKPPEDVLMEDSLETLDVLKSKLLKQGTDDELLQKLSNATIKLDAKEELISVLEARLVQLEGRPGSGAPRFSEEKQIIVDKLQLNVKDKEDNDYRPQQKPHDPLYSHAIKLNNNMMCQTDLNDTQMDTDKKCLQNLKETNATYKEQVEQVTTSSKDFEAMFHNLHKQKEALEPQVSNLSHECINAVNITRKGEVKLNEFSQKLQIHMAAENRLQLELDECHHEIKRLAQQVADTVASERRLKKELSEVENKRRSLDGDIQEWKEKKFSTSQDDEFECWLLKFMEEINQLTASKNEYLSLVSGLEQEKADLKNRLEDAQKEIRISHVRLDELVGQIAGLTTTFDSWLTVKRSVYSRALGFENEKAELETQISVLEEISVQCFQGVSDFEAQPHNTAEGREPQLLVEERNSQQKQSLVQELDQKGSKIISLQHSLSDLEKVLAGFRVKQSLLEHHLQAACDECISVKARCANLEVQIMETKADAELRDLALKAEMEIRNMLEEQVKIMRENEIQGSEQQNELIRLQNYVDQVQYKLAKQQEEKSEFESKIKCLEEEKNDFVKKLKSLEKENIEFETRVKSLEEGLEQKVTELTTTKNQLKSFDAFGDSVDISDLQERLKVLEKDCKEKEEQLAKVEQAFMEREADLFSKLEALEQSNEQLVKDLATDQLGNELIRLQNQNSVLSRREQDLLSKLQVQEILQTEIERLEEANDLLEARLTKVIETAENPSVLEEIVNLETELAEAVEANNMYKLQLKRIFEKEPTLNGDFGDVDRVIRDLCQYKKRATELEMELHDIHERYSLVSLQLAEAEAERGELLITVKNLKGVRQSMKQRSSEEGAHAL